MTAKRRKPVPTPGARRRTPTAGPASAPAAGPATNGAAPVSWGRPDAAALAAAVLGPLALYVATLPRTVVLEDDGLFLMAGVHLGVAHPPGYPLYTLIVHLFTRLPFGDPAFLGHLSSAVLGALACGAVYACARLLRASPAPALIAAWLFGVSEQFWAQAIITEVYTLNALLFFAAYALVLLGARDPRREWPLWCAAVAWGAGLANHWPLMVLATPGLALALLPVWREVLPRLPRLLGAALVTAATPYGWIAQPPLGYGAIGSDFWFYIGGSGSTAPGRPRRVPGVVRGRPVQTTLPGAALEASGRWPGAAASPPSPPRARGSLILLLGFEFDVLRVAVFRCTGSLPPCGWPWGRSAGPGRGPAARGDGRPAASDRDAGHRDGRRGSAGSPGQRRRPAETVNDLLPPDAPAAIGPLAAEQRRDSPCTACLGLVFANRLYDPRRPEDERAGALDALRRRHRAAGVPVSRC